MTKQKISTSIENTQIGENGEIIKTERITTKYVEREPDYIKLYIKDILKLSDISNANNSILYAILKRLNYQNEVFLLKHVIDEISFELKLKEITIRKAIAALSEKNILIKKSRGCYLVSPYLFGRGKWEDIRSIRLNLVYDERGRHIYNVKIDREEIINSFENENKEEI